MKNVRKIPQRTEGPREIVFAESADEAEREAKSRKPSPHVFVSRLIGFGAVEFQSDVVREGW